MNVYKADVYTDFQGLAELKADARKNSPEALKEVAKQFESIFLNMVLSSMRDAKLAKGIMDNNQSEFYQDMYDQQLAIHLSGDPGIGLADLIVRQLSPEQELNLVNKLDLDAYRSNTVRTLKATEKPDLKTETKLKSSADLPITSSEQFTKQLWPYAQKAAKQLGVEPKVLLAQAALETGWGHSVIQNQDNSSSYNLFNIKADRSWKGKQIQIETLEFEKGIAKKTRSGFRSYDSYQQSFQDYVQFIKNNPRYAEALKQVGKPERYMRALQQAGYATDPGYADKVMKIYHGKTLSAYDPRQIFALN